MGDGFQAIEGRSVEKSGDYNGGKNESSEHDQVGTKVTETRGSHDDQSRKCRWLVKNRNDKAGWMGQRRGAKGGRCKCPLHTRYSGTSNCSQAR